MKSFPQKRFHLLRSKLEALVSENPNTYEDFGTKPFVRVHLELTQYRSCRNCTARRMNGIISRAAAQETWRPRPSGLPRVPELLVLFMHL